MYVWCEIPHSIWYVVKVKADWRIFQLLFQLQQLTVFLYFDNPTLLYLCFCIYYILALSNKYDFLSFRVKN